MKKTEATHPGMTISSGICQNKEVLQCLEQETCDLAILPYAASVQGWKVREFMKEQLFVCVTKEHELAGHTRLFWRDLNGFNFLLRSELGFWDTLCKEKMPASRFLVQTEEEVFDELVNASTLPCFTTDYVTDREGRYQNRVNISIVDTDANITYFLYSKMNKK